MSLTIHSEILQKFTSDPTVDAASLSLLSNSGARERVHANDRNADKERTAERSLHIAGHNYDSASGRSRIF